MNYVTLDEGQDFRKIAKAMTKAGYPMNHATARNLLFSGLEKLFKSISKELGIFMSHTEREELLKKQEIHDYLGDILLNALKEEKKQKTVKDKK